MSPRPLTVLHVFGRMERGGAELRAIELAESFPRDRVRCDFLVLTGLSGVLDERVTGAGGDLIKCRLDSSFPVNFYRLLRQRRYDIIESHVHFFSGAVLAIARAARTPGRVAVFHTAVVNDRADTWLRRLQLGICRRLIDRFATDILAVGEGTMCGAWNERWQSDARCRVIHMGIPPARLDNVRRAAPAAPTIVNVASLQPLKNQLRLIRILARALRHIPELHLQLIGREVGGYGQQIRRAAVEAGVADRVHLAGEVDDPMPWIARSSLMILPSLWEGLPCAALEACALGVPLLATDLPGTRELADHFPHVTLMSLDDCDDAWAACAARLIAQGVSAHAGAAEYLNRSPFTLEKMREAHYEVWSRSLVSA